MRQTERRSDMGSDIRRAAAAFGRLGGYARAKRLTKKQLQVAARKAVRARGRRTKAKKGM